jgi:serine/threonine protein kinase
MAKAFVGRNFGSYWIKDKLGSGGMASVFEAVQKKTFQKVALKILHEQYNDDFQIRKRFEHEASIAARLEHPNIVPIWDFGEFKKRVYLAMPLMEGGNFAVSLSKTASVSYKTSLEVLTLLADALDYAHSKGVIHRDFKLENILLNRFNVPAISDFGIAQSPENTRVTVTGQILGSPKYLAPENFESHGIVDYRVDLYAFAVTAYLMLTGYFPFTGPNAMNIIDKHRNGFFPKPSKVNTQLPIMVDDIFEKALAKNADRRFSSAREFITRLDAAFSNIADGSITIYLDEENPLLASKSNVSSLSSAETLNISNLTVISGAITSESKRALPAYQNHRQGKFTKLVLSLLLSGSLLLCAILGLSIQGLLGASDLGTVIRNPNLLNGNQVLFVTQTALFLSGRETGVPTDTSSPTVTPTPTDARMIRFRTWSRSAFASTGPVSSNVELNAAQNQAAPVPMPTNPPQSDNTAGTGSNRNSGNEDGNSNGNGNGNSNGNGNGNGRGSGRNRN